MFSRLWLIPLAAFGAALLYRVARQGTLPMPSEAARAPAMPSARVYDAFSGRVNEPMYARVAREVAAMLPAGRVLDVGCGPGRLDVRLAREAPNLEVVGLDVEPDMIDLARRRAESAGVADRVRFEVGDVAAMPFRDGQFDLVVSTLSLHHWPDPRRGLFEVHRVLKPGGQACIYDVAEWVLRLLHHGTTLSQEDLAGIFEGGVERTDWWKVGPVPLATRVCLRKA